MKKISVILVLFLLAALNGWGDIIVRQDKEGNVTISNDYSGKDYNRYRTPKKRRSRVKSKTWTVPFKYQLKVRRLARKYGVKESLITAVARAESSFNPFAVSKKGAVGIMQLMPDTARQYGVVNRYNADQNMDAGVRHLKYLYKKYNYSLPLTLAAYNAGEEAVKKYKGVPPYKETKNYIKRVMRFMGMSHTGVFASKTSKRIYQYRTTDGKIIITDSFPSNAVSGSITILE
ncbi:MAG: lytic transglycosylase domain-containing protein [bacterium]|nr:lytic transglycosylase domain-containing protein [bacterium]